MLQIIILFSSILKYSLPLLIVSIEIIISGKSVFIIIRISLPIGNFINPIFQLPWITMKISGDTGIDLMTTAESGVIL